MISKLGGIVTGTKIIPAPSVYLDVIEGLGNQFFQYACSYAIARKYNLTLFLYVPDVSRR